MYCTQLYTNVLHLQLPVVAFEGYAPLPGLEPAASLSSVAPDEDSYIVHYPYAAQVINKSESFSHTVIY